MTRREYYDLISRMGIAHYGEYREQAERDGMAPLGMDEWLNTEMGSFPGYAEGDCHPEDVGRKDRMSEMAKEVESVRGPAPEAPKFKDEDEDSCSDDSESNTRYMVYLPDGSFLTGDAAKKWISGQKWRKNESKRHRRTISDDHDEFDEIVERVIRMVF